MKKKINYLILLLTAIFIVGCTNVEDASVTDKETVSQEVTTNNSDTEKTVTEESVSEKTSTQSTDELFKGYKLIEVDGGDLSGHREPNVVVDIGLGTERIILSPTNMAK